MRLLGFLEPRFRVGLLGGNLPAADVEDLLGIKRADLRGVGQTLPGRGAEMQHFEAGAEVAREAEGGLPAQIRLLRIFARLSLFMQLLPFEPQRPRPGRKEPSENDSGAFRDHRPRAELARAAHRQIRRPELQRESGARPFHLAFPGGRRDEGDLPLRDPSGAPRGKGFRVVRGPRQGKVPIRDRHPIGE